MKTSKAVHISNDFGMLSAIIFDMVKTFTLSLLFSLSFVLQSWAGPNTSALRNLYQGHIGSFSDISSYCRALIEEAVPITSSLPVTVKNRLYLKKLFKKGFVTALRHQKACQEVMLNIIALDSLPINATVSALNYLTTVDTPSEESSSKPSIFEEIVLVTHQLEHLQSGTSGVINAKYSKIPKVVLVSKTYPLKDSSLFHLADKLVLSDLGGFDNIATPIVAQKIYAFGGYCEMCLSKSISQLIAAAYHHGLSSIEVILNKNLVYTYQGSKRSLNELTNPELQKALPQVDSTNYEDFLDPGTKFKSNRTARNTYGRSACSSFLNPKVDLITYLKEHFNNIPIGANKISSRAIDDGVQFTTSEGFIYSIIAR